MFYYIFLLLICSNILSLFTSIAVINITSVLMLLFITLYLIRYPVSLVMLKQQIIDNKFIAGSLILLPSYIFIHQLCFTHSFNMAFKALVEWRTLLYGVIFIIPFLFYPKLFSLAAKFFLLNTIIFSLIGLGYFLFTGKPFNQEIYKHAPYLSSQILVTGIFLCWQISIYQYNKKIKYLLFILGVLASIMLFFATSRRTGYIIYIISFGVFIIINFQYIFKVKSLKYSLTALFLILLVLGGLYLSPTMHERFKEAVQEKEMYTQGNFETSNGLRLRFWNISSKIIQQSPIFGVGFTNYSDEFRKIEHKLDGYNIKTRFVHPHNEFIHVWSCFGIIAFLNYVFILLFPLIYYTKLNRHIINQYNDSKNIKLNLNENSNNFNDNKASHSSVMSIAHKALIIAYVSSIVGTLFNAMAIDMIEGHFFSLILAGYYSFYINTKNK